MEYLIFDNLPQKFDIYYHRMWNLLDKLLQKLNIYHHRMLAHLPGPNAIIDTKLLAV